VPVIASVMPYTPLELAGRDVYLSEGCYNCHSQMVRPIYAETKRYAGGYSKAGEYIYDHPFQWGSRRIGPDLFREGGIRTESWHYRHFKDPPAITAGSIMPPYTWLLSKDLDFASIPTKLRAMRALGVPYDDETVAHGEQLARAQALQVAERLMLQEAAPVAPTTQGGAASDPRRDAPLIPNLENKQVIALIAYLQRLGTDANAAPDAEPVFTAPPAGGVATIGGNP
jgi:cytochrome c oxidase cbb3-type subunit I/II